MTFIVRSERQPGVTVLRETASNMDGDQSINAALPAGFGDCIILDAFTEITNIATLVATNLTRLGPTMRLQSSSDVRDFVGAPLWQVGWAQLQLTAHFKPFRGIYWREEEVANIEFAEVDTNAAPTADMRWSVRVVRLRNQGRPLLRIPWELY